MNGGPSFSSLFSSGCGRSQQHAENFVFAIFGAVFVALLLAFRLWSGRRQLQKIKPTEKTCLAGCVATLLYFLSASVYYGGYEGGVEDSLDATICQISRNMKHETSVIVMAIFIWWSRQRVVASRVLEGGSATGKSILLELATGLSILNLIVTPILAETFYGAGSDYFSSNSSSSSTSNASSCVYCQKHSILLSPGYVACSVAVGGGALFAVVAFQLYFTYTIVRTIRQTSRYTRNADASLLQLTKRSQRFSLLIAFQTIAGMSLFALKEPYAAMGEQVVFLLFALSFFYEQFLSKSKDAAKDAKSNGKMEGNRGMGNRDVGNSDMKKKDTLSGFTVTETDELETKQIQ